jgi:hypothetical protein
VLHVIAEENDRRGAAAAGERGQVKRLVAAILAEREDRGIARIDAERIGAQDMPRGARPALALAPLDRDAQALERRELRLGGVPAPPAPIGRIEDVGLRRDLVGVVYRDDRERPAVAIAPGGQACEAVA